MKKANRKTITTILVLCVLLCTGVFCCVGCQPARKPSIITNAIVMTDGAGRELSDGDELPERMVLAAYRRLVNTANIDATEVDDPFWDDADIATTDVQILGSKTLTATVKPFHANNKDVSWSVSFDNPLSEWALGKSATDYIQIVESDNPLTVTVNCLQPFGEPIIVSVTSDDAPEISRECVCNFVARIQCSLDRIGAGAVLSFGTTQELNVNVVYGVGTVRGTFEVLNIALTLADALYMSTTINIQDPTCTHSDTTILLSQWSEDDKFVEMGECTRWLAGSEQANYKWQESFYKYIATHSGETHAFLTADVIYYYNGDIHSTSRINIPVRFDPESVKINVTDIELSETEIIF